MPETILLALLCAKLKKYEIRPLFKSWTIYPVLIFECILIVGQVSTYYDNYKIVEIFGSATTLYLMLYLFLIFKYNLSVQAIAGSICVICGGLLNDLAIKANDGFMPVFQSLSYYTGRITLENYHKAGDIHIIGTPETKLKILTDYIDLGYTILSIGDLFIRAFVFIVIYYSIKKINIQRRNKNC